jgi:stage V sporulation protein B
MKNKKSSFLAGAFILAAGGIFSKFLGMFFKIPLSYILSDVGLGYYTMAYPLYSTFLSISTVGLPTAVSKMVSERVSLGNYKGAYRVLTLAQRLLTTLGLIASLAMFLGAGAFTKLYGTPEVLNSILALSLAPFLVAMVSAYRGFFQGMEKMSYSSVSQIVDQFFRVGVGLAAAFFLMKATNNNEAYGAAGASVGATVGALASLIFLVVAFYRYKSTQTTLIETPSAYEYTGVDSSIDIYKKLIMIALPLATGGLVTTVMGLINSFTIKGGLVLAGFTQDLAVGTLGVLEQKAQTIVNVPFILGTALSASLVPSISASYARRDIQKAIAKTSVATKISFLISMPAAAGLSILSEPIMVLLFGQGSASSAVLLKWLSYVVVFTLGMTTLQGILQGAGHYYKPIKNMLIGALVKYLLNVFLIRIPEINIYGAIISSVTASAVIFFLNFIDTKRHIGIENVVLPIIKIFFCTAVMGLLVLYTYPVLSVTLGAKLAVIPVIALAMIVYAALIYITRTITKEDFAQIRG